MTRPPYATRLIPGFHPFWFWNDRIEEAELRRQIRQMKDQGIKGFYIHPRQGLEQPYLGEAFLDLVAAAVEEAGRQGLTVHLYDEYPYPSGIAGGRVTAGRPALLATRLVQSCHDLEGGPVRLTLPPGLPLFCQAFPLGAAGVDWDRPLELLPACGPVLASNSYNEVGLTEYNRKRYFASHPVPVLETRLPAGRWRVHVALQALVENHKYWGHFADVMRPEAVACFLRETHERYFGRLGPAFPRLIASIFVDETAPAWTPELPEWFRERWDRDLLPDLPALIDDGHPRHLQVRRELREVQYERFCRSFEEPIRDWCQAHGIRYAGEKPAWRLEQLRYMDLPGCEPGHVKAGAPLDLLGPTIRGNAKAAASAAFFHGKEGALCECYHSLGWSANLQDAKRIAEGLMLCGVDYLVPHGFFYSTHALRKHDAPPTFFFQMPFWPLFGLLSARLDRLQAAWSGMGPEPQLLILEPSDGQPSKSQLEAYVALQRELMGHQVEFLLADQPILEQGAVSQARLLIQGLSVAALLVPPQQSLAPALRLLLEGFAAQGLPVLFFQADEDPRALAERLRDLVAPPLRLEAPAGQARQVWMGLRSTRERRGWFLLNTGATPVELDLSGPERLSEIPLDPALPPALERSPAGWRRRLAPHESVFLASDASAPVPPAVVPVEPIPVGIESGCAAQGKRGEEAERGLSGGDLSREGDEASRRPPQADAEDAYRNRPLVHLALPQRLALQPLGPNLLRLGTWALSLRDADGNWGPAREVPAVPLANQLKRSGLPFAPSLREQFGCAPALVLPRLQLRYEARFVCDFEGPVSLLLEPGSLVGEWSLCCNDGPEVGAAAFAAVDTPLRGLRSLDLTPQLRPGPNRIRVTLTTNRLDGGLLNPLYLSGPFGVLAGGRLCAPLAKGGFEEYEGNCLPYFAGTLEYRFRAQVGPLPDAPAFVLALDLPAGFSEAVELAMGQGPFQPLPWEPRRLLVRREAFSTEIRLRVHSSLIRAFEGEWFDTLAHRYRPVEPAALD